MKNTAKVLQIIEENKIKPKPRCFFVCLDILYWVISVIFVVLASLALSVFLYTVLDYDKSVFIDAGLVGSYKCYLCSIFWIVVFLCVAIIAYYNFIKTKHSHRIFITATWVAVSAYILLSIIFYYNNSFESVEERMIRMMPYYHDIFDTKMSVWSRPELGLISGEITKIPEGMPDNKICIIDGKIVSVSTSTKSITIVDIFRDEWGINVSSTTWRVDECLEMGERVRVKGKVLDDDNRLFRADVVMEW